MLKTLKGPVVAIGLVTLLGTLASVPRNVAVAVDEPSASTGQPESTALERELFEIVQRQAKAWNAGNIDRFMDAYWKSEKLTFCSGGNVRRGWKATRDGYKKKYPTPTEMGKLTFSDLEVQSLGDGSALMLGCWRLDGTGGEKPPEGNFSLVWRKLDAAWVIVHDHTSLQQ